MKFISKINFLLLIFTFNSFVLGQGDLKIDRYISKTFWLRHNLALRGEVKVYPNNIEFEDTDGSIIHRGEQVKIEAINVGNEFSKIKFSQKNSVYELLVQSNTKDNFRKSFYLAFSSKPIKESLVKLYCESKMKTKSDVLKCLGFPLETTSWEENGAQFEKFYYTCWFLNNCIGYDTFWITFKNKKIDDVSGTI